MTNRFTLGVEQEFQLVDAQTGDLTPRIEAILEKGEPILGERIKAEAKQAAVELITDVCADMAELRQELPRLRTALYEIVEEQGATLISAGTHPTADWRRQKVTPGEHYEHLIEQFQEMERTLVIYGLHIHVAVDNAEIAIPLLNQLRTWLPHLLALSSNSPFWEGYYTGMKSFRTSLWKPLPRSGLPDILPNRQYFDRFVDDLILAGCIESGKDICWDLRPHPLFNTLEFRICDMPATQMDVLALTALCQALVAKVAWLQERNMPTDIVPRNLLEENKWAAMHDGLDAEIVDFARKRRMRMRDSLHELLNFVEDVIDDLGSEREMNYLRSLIDDPRGTGADRQIAIYRETGDAEQVTRFLLEMARTGHPVPGY